MPLRRSSLSASVGVSGARLWISFVTAFDNTERIGLQSSGRVDGAHVAHTNTDSDEPLSAGGRWLAGGFAKDAANHH